MKEEVFYGKGMERIKEEDNELYQAIVTLNDAVWNAKVLDTKTQKLIAIGIASANADTRATKQQMNSAKKELGISRDEVLDVLKVVLLTSGMQPFNKALQIANEIFE